LWAETAGARQADLLAKEQGASWEFHGAFFKPKNGLLSAHACLIIQFERNQDLQGGV
jgi:hypothetical protein